MTAAQGNRFLFVDGLRGIAAMLVVLFHFRLAVDQTANDWLWPVVGTFFDYGYLGVDIFFVISGFVISYSVRNADHTPGFLFRFGIRRSIRLDPPYWLTIFLELLLIKLGLLLFPALNTPFPSIEKILAHFVYMQDLLVYGNIVDIFWTLCYEVQFYLVFVSFLVLLRSLKGVIGNTGIRFISIGVCSAAFIISAVIFFGPVETPVNGLFIDRWFQFFIGVLAMRCVLFEKVTLAFILASLVLVMGSLLYPSTGADNGLTALVVAWALVFVARKQMMLVWLSGPVSQFLGRISYSLYLVHAVVGWRFIKLLHELHGEDFTAVQAWLAYGAGVAVSVFSAWLMYKLIEAPSIKLCHLVKMDRPLSLSLLKKN